MRWVWYLPDVHGKEGGPVAPRGTGRDGLWSLAWIAPQSRQTLVVVALLADSRWRCRRGPTCSVQREVASPTFRHLEPVLDKGAVGA